MSEAQEQNIYKEGEATSSWSYNRHKNFQSKRAFFNTYFLKREFQSTRALELGTYIDKVLHNSVASTNKEQEVIDAFDDFKKMNEYDDYASKRPVSFARDMNDMVVQINGEIDRVMVTKDGSVFPLDFKSGVDLPPRGNLREQLTFYVTILLQEKSIGAELLKDADGNYITYGFHIKTYPATFAEDSISGKTEVLRILISQSEVDALEQEIERRHKVVCEWEQWFIETGCRSDDEDLAEYAHLVHTIKHLEQWKKDMEPEVLKKIQQNTYYNEEYGSFSTRASKRTVWTDEAQKKAYLSELRAFKEEMAQKYNASMETEENQSVNYRAKDETDYLEERDFHRPEEVGEIDANAIPF